MKTSDEAYSELTLWSLENYYDGVDNLGMAPRASIAAALDDSTTGWSKQPLTCVATLRFSHQE